MVISSTSFLGASVAQSNRLKSLNSLMDELQRQATTRKKADTFSGLGLDAYTVQDSRMEKNRLESYKSNIDSASTRIKVMSQVMQRVSDIGRELRSSLQNQFRPSATDMETIRLSAQQGIGFIEDLINTKVDGKYLFAGSNSDIPPMNDMSASGLNIQSQLANWLNGTINTNQFNSNVNNLTSTQLGFDPAMSASGSVTVRIDDAGEVDMTSIATTNGFKDMLRALNLAANLDLPASTDVPTQQDFSDVLDNLLTMVDSAVTQIDKNNTTLGSQFDLMTKAGQNHQDDINLYSSIIDRVEGVDATEVFTKIQSLQTQLSASYQVTSLISQLSLANYL